MLLALLGLVLRGFSRRPCAAPDQRAPHYPDDRNRVEHPVVYLSGANPKPFPHLLLQIR
jgi:hypothetical protein